MPAHTNRTIIDRVRSALTETADVYGAYPFSDAALLDETGATQVQLTRCLATLARRDEWRTAKGVRLDADPSVDGRPLRRNGVLLRGSGVAPAPTFVVERRPLSRSHGNEG
jgi:hypothetical protein